MERVDDRGRQDNLTGGSRTQIKVKGVLRHTEKQENRRKKGQTRLSVKGCLNTALNSWGAGRMFTGQRSDTRRLVVAISLSGSAVSFSLTAGDKLNTSEHEWATWVSEKQKTSSCSPFSLHLLDYLYKTKVMNEAVFCNSPHAVRDWLNLCTSFSLYHLQSKIDTVK